jgi:hypothetical protein
MDLLGVVVKPDAPRRAATPMGGRMPRHSCAQRSNRCGEPRRAFSCGAVTPTTRCFGGSRGSSHRPSKRPSRRIDPRTTRERLGHRARGAGRDQGEDRATDDEREASTERRTIRAATIPVSRTCHARARSPGASSTPARRTPRSSTRTRLSGPRQAGLPPRPMQVRLERTEWRLRDFKQAEDRGDAEEVVR